MKKLLLILAIGVFAASCGGNTSDSTTDSTTTTDTTTMMAPAPATTDTGAAMMGTDTTGRMGDSTRMGADTTKK